MRISTLKSLGALYISNITQGFSEYSHEVRSLSAQEARQVLLAEQQNPETTAAYADFYYHALDSQAKTRINSVLTQEEVAYIQQLTKESVTDPDDLDIIFPLEEKLLEVITKLNEQEMLFSTIYFVGKTTCSTWWGNYNKEYVIFSSEKERGTDE